MTAKRRRRLGFAVAVAVYMLAAIAGLAAASFHAVVQARRAPTRSTRHAQAASAADAALGGALAAWDVAKRDSLPIGAVDSSAVSSPAALSPGAPGAERARLFVIRLTRGFYWLASVGDAAVGTSVEARRVHNLLVEIQRPALPARAALMVRGSVVLGAGGSITADDVPPPGWTDCPPAADTARGASVLIPDGEAARFDDGRPIPDARVDSAAADARSYQLFGRVAAPALADRATTVVAAGAILSPAPDIGRGCQASDGHHSIQSWGEPTRSGSANGCERFYPVIHAAGDLTLAGGRGQGVLLVAGRLRIEGPFLFYGVIIAAGGIDVSGPDVQIYGAVLSAASNGVGWSGTADLHRSSCAVARVADAAARAYALPLRGWAQLF